MMRIWGTKVLNIYITMQNVFQLKHILELNLHCRNQKQLAISMQWIECPAGGTGVYTQYTVPTTADDVNNMVRKWLLLSEKHFNLYVPHHVDDLVFDCCSFWF